MTFFFFFFFFFRLTAARGAATGDCGSNKRPAGRVLAGSASAGDDESGVDSRGGEGARGREGSGFWILDFVFWISTAGELGDGVSVETSLVCSVLCTEYSVLCTALAASAVV